MSKIISCPGGYSRTGWWTVAKGDETAGPPRASHLLGLGGWEQRGVAEAGLFPGTWFQARSPPHLPGFASLPLWYIKILTVLVKKLGVNGHIVQMTKKCLQLAEKYFQHIGFLQFFFFYTASLRLTWWENTCKSEIKMFLGKLSRYIGLKHPYYKCWGE